MRLANSVEALSGLGDADLFTLSPRDRELPLELPPEIRAHRLKVALYPGFPPVPVGRLSGCGNEDFPVTW